MMSAIRGLLGGSRGASSTPLTAGRCDLLTTAQRQVGGQPSSNTRADAGFTQGDVAGTQVEFTVQRARGRKAAWVAIVICIVLVTTAAVPVAFFMRSTSSANSGQPIRYLGVYERGTPLSYAGVTSFTAATGVHPDVIMYYSSWEEPFQTSFATTAAEHNAVPLVQINPYGVNLAAIASGQYDGYLTAYAEAVRAYAHPVILSFGHEMNGHWYPWGYMHTSPAVFVAAWRHIVTLFRGLGTQNVIWLWTVNIVETSGGIPPPGSWWPGSSYVTWVGIDGYYYSPSVTFAYLFGPTIAAVRELTSDPILIAETAAAPAVGQPAKVTDLFDGIRIYGLLGFIWFEVQEWGISSPAAIAAFRQGAEAYQRPPP
jgi:mannan endo-1,4-beta-mannosidase